MKIACVTPFYHLSSVGDVAARTAQAMQSDGHDVVLIGTGRAPYWETTLEFIALGEFGRLDRRRAEQFDAIVYHAVNDPAAAPSFWLMERVPGVVILHDRTYVHGYDGYTRLFLGRPRYFETLAERYYGSEGAAFVRRFRGWQASPEDIFAFNLVPAVLENALGAVVHFEEFGEAVRRLTSIPVVSSRRPAYPRWREAPAAGAMVSAKSDGTFVLAYVGHVSPYRCLPQLFEVLRDRPDLLARMSVRILGKVDDDRFVAELQRTATDFGIAHAIEWQFNAGEDEKHDLLESSDAAFNVRSLNSEGLSGSLMEEMTYGLPVIVNADGFAREVPADAVCFVEREDLYAGVERALDMLVNRPDERERIGRNAAQWATANGSTTDYARGIVELASRTRDAKPAKALVGRLRDAIERMGERPGSDLEMMARKRMGLQ